MGCNEYAVWPTRLSAVLDVIVVDPFTVTATDDGVSKTNGDP
jgi:hypothetical protein